MAAPEAAEMWSAKLEEEISSLSYFPLRYPLLDMEPWRTDGIRRMVTGKFNIYYWIDEFNKKVWVVALVLGKRDQQMALREISVMEQ